MKEVFTNSLPTDVMELDNVRMEKMKPIVALLVAGTSFRATTANAFHSNTSMLYNSSSII